MRSAKGDVIFLLEEKSTQPPITVEAPPLTLNAVRKALAGMYDAEIVAHQTGGGQWVELAFVQTMIDIWSV
jgi:hypothetical protein